MSGGLGTTDDDIDIEPLSGKPFFHTVMLKTHVASPYQLVLPAKFHKVLPSKTVPVSLLHGNRIWETSYIGSAQSHKRFDTRWRAFVGDNKLKMGDICIFELMECNDTEIKFKVQILRGDFPSVLLDRQDGTCNNPLVIDDD